ncbi:MAG: hypothetical protein H8E39_00440 [Alphaproteobacteria bacterium]|nr:hypothetical protein [Alphaproteobacteria bacterium]
MQDSWTLNIIWWITAVELPALTGLFWLGWRNRRDADDAIIDARHEFETGLRHLREGLAAYKLEVAKSYASIPYLKEVERRLTSHLVRIENKLDGSIARPAPRHGPGGAP